MYILFINPTKSPEALAPVFPAHSEFLERYCKAGKFIGELYNTVDWIAL